MSSSRITAKGKVGVFGGTFDPIHNGHVAVARAVLESLDLDRVLFVVTSDQWLRDNPPVASAADRFHMVELAVDNVLEFTASDVDIVREGSTYTVDTLRDLREQLGDEVELYLIVGADSAASMNRWKDADQIGGLAKIVAVGRPGQSFATDSLDESHPASGAEYVEGPMIDVSATLVRGFLSDELPIDEIVASEVAKYIEQRNLYR
ncbi:MAG: nicotinate-nucleotide adenylyltransferase [Chloroflexi bacterium]|jgi:nicotinate-nucleotide adenylyltransferase|nr:nicotinate-nucleotide adenylyltransferase [Chloroflexota bacterium]